MAKLLEKRLSKGLDRLFILGGTAEMKFKKKQPD